MLMMTAIQINVLTDFSDEPIGRFPEDGPNNGQRFRLEFLIPALEQHDSVFIDLDGTEGYGSSFLEEAFGGLVRKHGYSSSELAERLSFKSEEDDSFISEILQYIQEAVPETRG